MSCQRGVVDLAQMSYRDYLFILLSLTSLVRGSQKTFSVSDDVFGFPAYEIDFPPDYISEQEAIALLETSKHSIANGHDAVTTHSRQYGSDLTEESVYERVVLDDRVYLCSIPNVKPTIEDPSEPISDEDMRKELTRAEDRGWELLRDMEGKQCLYYTTGWWSYSFCYNSHVTQFHGLSSGAGGARVGPPQQDPTTPSYVLGRYRRPQNKDPGEKDKGFGAAELQQRADSSYLVQRLGGGTPCDLTGQDRKVEIQFHCNPQSTDRIEWIKETSTCTYLMLVHTPRLCNEVAFQPPKASQAHTISCQQILTDAEIAVINTASPQSPVHAGNGANQYAMIGNIQLGGQKLVGSKGKRIERGRIVMTPEEKAQIIMMQKDGQLKGLSATEMRKLGLDTEKVEKFKKEWQEIAGKKDWKIERIEGNGQVILRGAMSDDSDDEGADEDQETSGTEEEYKAKS